MIAPIALLTLGGMLVFSALKGVSMVDVLNGIVGNTLDPKGHAMTTTPTDTSSTNPGDPTAGGVATGGDWTAPPGGAHGFKGPHADLLNKLAGIAQHSFHLTITATSNGLHVPASYHYRGEAFDAAGGTQDMHDFAQYVQDHYGNTISELIHNPGFAIKDGHVVNGSVFYAAVWAGHINHVHVAMG